MALSGCSLIGSIQRDCRDGNGGVIEIKVKVLPSLTTIAADYSVTSGTVTIASGSQSGWYTYYLEKNTAIFNEVDTNSRENGTSDYAQEMKIIFNKLSVAIRNELQVLAKNDVQIAVRDRNDSYFLMGYEFGAFLESATATTGTVGTDRSGYEMTFKANERVPKVYMSSSTYNTLKTA